MKRFAFRSVAFGASFLLVVAGLEATTGLWLTAPIQSKVHDLKYRDLFDRTQRHPNIVLGTSHAVYGIAPEKLSAPDFPVYNFGYRNATTLFYRKWYDVFTRYQGTPRTVIYCVDWFAFTDHTNRTLESDARHFPADLFLDMLRDRRYVLHKLIAFRSTLFADRGFVKGALMGNPMGRHDLSRFANGYVPYANDAGAHQAKPWKPGKRVESHRIDLERTLDRFRQDGVRVVLVQIPELLPVSGRHPAQNAEIAQIAAARGLPFLNYNEERRSALNDDASAFYDWGHLNDAGCQRFSAVLARDLKALPGFVSTSAATRPQKPKGRGGRV